MAWCAHCRDHHTPDECRAMTGCTRRECSPLPVLRRTLSPLCVCPDIGAPCRRPAGGTPLTDQQIGSVIDGLGVEASTDDGDMIAGAVVLLKIVEGDGQVRLQVAWSDGMSWLERVGMLDAARMTEHTLQNGEDA